MPSQLPVFGWKEQAGLPEWGIDQLRVKLDTGARSSALHVEDLATVDHHPVGGAELPVLRFTVLVGSRYRPVRREVTTPAVAFRIVRDTGAREERRPVVRTRIVCGPLDLETDVTLTDRTGMNFRMLLGRLTLRGRCLVDPDRGYLQTPPPSRRRDGSAPPGPA